MPKKILGIDPGLANLGLSVLDDEFRLLGSYYLSTSPRGSLSGRLNDIRVNVLNLIYEIKPDVVAIEEFVTFGRKKLNSGFNTSKVIGVIMAVCGSLDIPVYLYFATEVKRAATGSTRADKKQMKAGVENQIAVANKLGKKMNDHQYDSIAVALAYLKGLTTSS